MGRLVANYDISCGNYVEIYPQEFDKAQMDVPFSTNVAFDFVVSAPKRYVFDTWHLSRTNGGPWKQLTHGTPPVWPACANGMEVVHEKSHVIQKLGNVSTPEAGDTWHFEWIAGLPYFTFARSSQVVMTSVHARATLVDGPGEDQTTVKVESRVRPGVSTLVARVALEKSCRELVEAAPRRFEREQYIGPIPQRKLSVFG